MKITPHTIGTTATRVLRVNASRKVIGIANTHTTAIVYFNFNRNVSATNGFPIYPQSDIILQQVEGDDTTRGVFLISDTATTLVRVYES